MIGILGYYGHGSRGDDLLQYALTKLFGETYAFTVSSPRRPTPVPLEKVNEMEALIVGGGTLLGKAAPYPLCDLGWIDGVEVPLYVFGVGAKFPHKNGILEEGRLAPKLAQAHHALEFKVRLFGVRGPLTQEVMAREGIKAEIISDPVLALVPEAQVERSSTWLINFRHPNWFGRADYAETARTLVQMLGKVVPLQALAFDEDDARFMRSIGLQAQVPDLGILRAMIQSSAGVVAMRLHACVLAAVCGVPFINLGYELKSWDFHRTVAPTNPINFVPKVPGPHAVMADWDLLAIETLRRAFLENVQEQVAHWRQVLTRQAKTILEEL